jgi:DNA repair protein RadC
MNMKSLSELLTIIIRNPEHVKRLLDRFSSLCALDQAHIVEIANIIGMKNAVKVKAVLEIGKRFFKERAELKRKLKTPSDVIEYVRDYYFLSLRYQEKEFFYAILLNVKNRPVADYQISKGCINFAPVDPKEIIKLAILHLACNVILVHNHPSGEPEPSGSDIELTNNLIQACRYFDITVLDHIIIGKNNMFSFAQKGLITSQTPGDVKKLGDNFMEV